jgi:hypothetical protein
MGGCCCMCFGRSPISCRSGNSSGWPGDLVPGFWARGGGFGGGPGGPKTPYKNYDCSPAHVRFQAKALSKAALCSPLRGTLGKPRSVFCVECCVASGSFDDSRRESLTIGPPAGRRPAGGPMLRLSRLEFGRNPGLKPDFRAGHNIA